MDSNTPDIHARSRSATTDVTLHLKALSLVLTTLDEDVQRFRDLSTGPERRAMVRSVFAFIEGSSFGLRSLAFHLAEMRGVALSTGEAMMAQEVAYMLNDKGEVEERLPISSPIANLRFSFNIFAKASGAAYKFPAGDARFGDLQRAQRIRNRINHPRSAAELEISDDDSKLVLMVGEWVGKQLADVLMTFAFRLRNGMDLFFSEVFDLPKTDTGGYSAESISDLLHVHVQNQDLVSFEPVSTWFANLGKPKTNGGGERGVA